MNPNANYDYPGANFYEDYLERMESDPDPNRQGFRLTEEISYGGWLNKILTNVTLPQDKELWVEVHHECLLNGMWYAGAELDADGKIVLNFRGHAGKIVNHSDPGVPFCVLTFSAFERFFR